MLHCFSSPGLLDPALERGWYVSFAGNVTYPNAYDLRAAARAVPAERLLVETDSPYLSPQPRRGRPNEPANVVHTVAALAAGPRRGSRRARRADRRQRGRGLRAPVSRFPVSPNRELGQHFLVDDNILGVIGRLAELGARRRRARDRARASAFSPSTSPTACGRVRAVELDRGLEPALRERLAGRDNVELEFGDALRLELGSGEPPPTKLVANLPYNVATPIVVESLDGLPDGRAAGA